jgi:class 3 adenylate cyclase
MAATGLPKPQPDHAVRMVRFARDCILQMAVLLEELELSLGDDTTNLAMRVGMHSGGVTAGVLRGDKTRFQLFGDTVNTASRMESNGFKGKIHCSQTTADALISAGRSQWLTSRVDKITAKGKGEMQT